MAVDFNGEVQVATISGIEVFGERSGATCGDVTINPGNYTFVTHHCANGKLEIRTPDNSLIHSVCRLHYLVGVCLNQSGAIYTTEWNGNKVCKH